MYQFNDLHGEEPNELTREWNIQPPEAHIKSRTSTTKTSPVVSVITGRINHHVIDNDDVEVQPSYFPVESNSESVPYPDTNTIKSTNDDEMDHLLELLHSEHDDYFLDVDLHMIQDLLVVGPPFKHLYSL